MTSLHLAPLSLKTRITLATLTIFVVGIWSLAFYVSRMLHADMERVSGEQQFSTVSFVAAEVNAELNNRLKALETIAAQAGSAMLGNNAALQALIEQRPVFQFLFNAGTFVTGTDGTAIASIPISLGRVGVNYSDRDFIAAALKDGKSTIGRPVMGKRLHSAIFVMAVPIRDTRGNVIGALAGVTDLAKPNFLDKIEAAHYGKSGSYLLNAPEYNLIVTSSDKSRIMQPLPPPGVNKILDRYIDGFEGYGISVNSRGVEELTAAKRIPAAGWFMGIVIPTEEAFSPIHDLHQRLLFATIFMTLLAGALTWWMLRRQFAPMLDTVQTLANLSDTKQPLPITRQDEIGELIGGFNRLLKTLGEREWALKESEFRWKFAIEGSGDGLWDWNVPQSTVYFSPRWKEMLGFTRDEIGSGLDEWSKRIHPDDLTQTLADVQAHLDGTTPFYINEHRVSCKDGSYKWILDRGLVVERDAASKPLRVIGTHSDVTERKKAETELIQYRNHLEELVAARTSELEQSRDAAEAGNRAKTIFLANMSHELRTPMSGVMGMIDLVLMRATDPKQIDWLNKSKGAAQRMLNVVNDIIDFSKAEADRLPLEEKNFSMSQMIDDVMAMQDITAQAKGLNLIREIPVTFPDQLSGDPFHLRQILLNFLGNACKFSDHGTITVRVSVAEQDGDSVLARFEVEDQGSKRPTPPSVLNG